MPNKYVLPESVTLDPKTALGKRAYSLRRTCERRTFIGWLLSNLKAGTLPPVPTSPFNASPSEEAQHGCFDLDDKVFGYPLPTWYLRVHLSKSFSHLANTRFSVFACGFGPIQLPEWLTRAADYSLDNCHVTQYSPEYIAGMIAAVQEAPPRSIISYVSKVLKPEITARVTKYDSPSSAYRPAHQGYPTPAPKSEPLPALAVALQEPPPAPAKEEIKKSNSYFTIV